MSMDITVMPLRKMRVSAQGLHRIEFPDGAGMPSGVYDVVGGIGWPMPITDGKRKGIHDGIGVVVLVGERRDRVWVAAEHAFSVVEAMRESGGDKRVAAVPYLADWLNRMWALFGCRRYWWAGDEGIFMTHVRRILDCESIMPKPELPMVDWVGTDDAVRLIQEWDQSGRLVFSDEGYARPAMNLYSADMVVTPALWGLAAVLSAVKWGEAKARSEKGERWVERERARAQINGFEGYV